MQKFYFVVVKYHGKFVKAMQFHCFKYYFIQIALHILKGFLIFDCTSIGPVPLLPTKSMPNIRFKFSHKTKICYKVFT